MKKLALIILAIVMMAVSLGGCNAEPVVHEYGQEVVVNGSFESWSGDAPTGWRFITDCGATIKAGSHKAQTDFVVDNEVGESFLTVNSGKLGWSFLTQTIKVEPGATYLVEVFIRIDENLSNGTLSTVIGSGAKVGILEDMNDPGIGRTSKSYWGEYKIHYYFTTEMDTIHLYLGLGDNVTAISGTAHFDGVSVKKVDTSSDAFKQDPKDTIYKIKNEDRVNLPLETSTVIIIVASVVVVTAVVIVVLLSIKKRKLAEVKKKTNRKK